MYCQNCKATLQDAAKFCTMCGARTNVSFCSNGHVLDAAGASCRYCPPAARREQGRVSAATTIDNLTPGAEVAPLGNLTRVDTGAISSPQGAARFGSTVIIQEEEESVGLLGWLVVLEGEQKWRDFRITKKKTTIGRAPECDIVLNQGQVSAKHASLRLMDDGLYLTDLDSSNGTFINGEEVMKQKLLDNELVRVGDVTLKFRSF